MRLIDADAVMDKACENLRVGDVLDRIPPSFIDNAPTIDAVPVVYCKDCKYADTERRNVTEERYYNAILICRNSNLCNDEPLAMWTTDFCSYGERKDGADHASG